MARCLVLVTVFAGGASAMSTVALKPLDVASRSNAALALRAAREAPDSPSGLVWLEHVNIVVGDRGDAERFYFEEGLGCSRDPGKPGGPGTKGTMWANLGAQQFHLAEEADDDPRQAVRGAIGLALPDCAAAAQRLEVLERAGVCGPLEVHGADRFTVRCPSGNVFHCYDTSYEDDVVDATKPKGPKMVSLHDRDGYGARGGPVAVRGRPGIRYVHFLVDDAEAAGAAYCAEFGGVATTQGETCAVQAGLGPVHLLFETAPPDPQADARQDGVHLCVYVDNFSKRYESLKPHCFTNPRFKHLDTCDTLDEARASRTFRFAFPEVPNLEHETRDLTHVQFLKQIHYEPR